MPNFEENNLSQEELTSGINQDSGTDETFALESMNEYPGSLPDNLKDENLPEQEDWAKADKQVESEELNESATEKTRTAGEPIQYEKSGVLPAEDTEIYGAVGEAEKIEPPQTGTVWDMFDKEDEGQTEKIKEGNVADTQPEYDSSAKYQAESIEESAKSTLSQEPTLQPESDLVEKISSVNELEPVQIDEDLKNLLQSEIEKSKGKNKDKANEEEAQATDEVSTDEKKEFIELAETEDAEAQVIDLGAITADKPSNYGLDSSVMEEIAEEELSEGMHIALPKRKPAVKPDETGEIKERKKLKIPFMYIGIAAGIILILSAVTLGVYKLFIEKPDEKAALLDSLKIKKLKPNASIAKVDTFIIESAKVDTAKSIAQQPEKRIDALQKTSTKKIILAEKQVKTKPQKEENHYQFIEKEKKQPKKKPDLIKPEKTEPVKLAEKVPEKKKEITQPIIPQGPEKLFVVQVYSTPNKNDAEEWLARLTNKNIQNAFISEQKIRDKIWYRIRFGNFRTRDEAMQEAMKYGFAHTWIDRIK